MKKVGTIYLTWRKGRGFPRIKVGKIVRNANDGVRFSYISEGVVQAKKFGFTYYTDFPDTQKKYSENVLEIFSQRLIKTDRADSNKFLEFWNIPRELVDDKYLLLAYTHGLLTTDNFEFLADFNLSKDIKFVSEISGLSHSKLIRDTIRIGDELDIELYPIIDFDEFAVKLRKDSKEIGFVKLIHSRIFYKKSGIKIKGTKLKVQVKEIDQNGFINRVFINISF